MKIKFDKTPFRELTKEEKEWEKSCNKGYCTKCEYKVKLLPL